MPPHYWLRSIIECIFFEEIFQKMAGEIDWKLAYAVSELEALRVSVIGRWLQQFFKSHSEKVVLMVLRSTPCSIVELIRIFCDGEF